jgi:hypothetical protein
MLLREVRDWNYDSIYKILSNMREEAGKCVGRTF